MKNLLLLTILIGFLSFQTKGSVDSIIHNGNVYTVNKGFEKAEAFAVKNGKFVEVGTYQNLQKSMKLILLLMPKEKLYFRV